MKPTRSDLSQRDLLEPALKIARKYGLTVEEMFGGRSPPAPAARLEFYRLLQGMGWSTTAMGRLCGKHHSTVGKDLKKHTQ